MEAGDLELAGKNVDFGVQRKAEVGLGRYGCICCRVKVFHHDPDGFLIIVSEMENRRVALNALGFCFGWYAVEDRVHARERRREKAGGG